MISNHIIKSLDTVRIKDVRDSIRRTLGRASSMTVAEIISKNKILYGLQEVVAYVRVANELKAELDQSQNDQIEVKDFRNPNKILRITIPRQVLNSQNMRDSERENL